MIFRSIPLGVVGLVGLAAAAAAPGVAAAQPAAPSAVRLGLEAGAAAPLGELAGDPSLGAGAALRVEVRLGDRLAATARAGYLRYVTGDAGAAAVDLHVVPLRLGLAAALAAAPAHPFVALEAGADLALVRGGARRTDLAPAAALALGYAAGPLSLAARLACHDLGAPGDALALEVVAAYFVVAR